MIIHGGGGEDVRDGVADMVFDFLEGQSWPLEGSSAMPGE